MACAPLAQERNEDWKEEAEEKKERRGRIKERLKGGEILGKRSYIVVHRLG